MFTIYLVRAVKCYVSIELLASKNIQKSKFVAKIVPFIYPNKFRQIEHLLNMKYLVRVAKCFHDYY